MEGTRRERFGRFYDGLTEYLITNDHTTRNQVGFYGYGSYFEKPDQEPADIDGGIMMPTLITDKKVVLDISQEIARLSGELGIEKKDIQINLLDKESSEDGRFLSYSCDYSLYVKEYGVSLAGDPSGFLYCLNGIDNAYDAQRSNAFNFRRVRNSLLLACSTMEESDERVEGEFRKLIDQVKRAPKKTLQLRIIRSRVQTPQWESIWSEIAKFVSKTSKRDAVAGLKDLVGDVDLSFYEGISAYEDPKVIGELLSDKQRLLKVWGEAVQAYEGIIKGYIERNDPMFVRVRTVV